MFCSEMSMFHVCFRGLVYDGKYSLQTRGLIILLMSKTAGSSTQSHLSTTDQDQIGGIYPRYCVIVTNWWNISQVLCRSYQLVEYIPGIVS